MRSIRYSAREEDFIVLGECGRKSGRGAALEVGELGLVRSSETRRALIDYRDQYGSDWTSHAVVSALPDGYLDRDGPFEPVSFGLLDDALTLEIKGL